MKKSPFIFLALALTSVFLVFVIAEMITNQPTSSFYITYNNLKPSTNITTSNLVGYNFMVNNGIYKAYFKNNSNNARAIRFMKEGYTIDYDLSGGGLNWIGQPSRPAATTTLGGGVSSNTLDTQINISGNKIVYKDGFGNTDITYDILDDRIKQTFILRELPSIKAYDELRYEGRIYFNASLSICANGICYKPSGTEDTFFTNGTVEFKDSTNKTIMYFDLPIVYDSVGNRVLGRYKIFGSNAQMGYEFRIPTTFLNSSVYPIYADPTVVSQEESKIIYEEGHYNITAQIKRNDNGSFVIAPQDIYINGSDETSLIFKARDYSKTNLTQYRIEYNSTKELNFDGNYYYILEQKSTTASLFLTSSTEYRRIINNDGICQYAYSNCTYSLSTDGKFLTVTFYADYDSDLGYIFIDPSYDYSITSSTSSQIIYTNRTDVTNLGLRNNAPVLFMDFNEAPENKINSPYNTSVNHTQGTYVKDNSLYNNHGTIASDFYNDIDWRNVGNLVNNSLQFDYGDRVYGSAIGTGYTQYTISLWFNAENATDRGIFSIGNLGNLFTLTALFSSTPGTLMIYCSRSGYGSPGATLATGVTTNTWHHLVMYKNGSNTNAIFDNGTVVGLSALCDPLSTTQYYTLGYASVSTMLRFDGSIDEAMFFNRTLSPDEISYIYNNQSAGLRNSGLESDPNLRVYYKLDELSGTTASSATGINDATLYNYPTTLAPFWNSTGGYDSSGAYQFDGVNDYMTIKDNSNLDITQELTLSAWVYKKSHVASANAGILSKYYAAASSRSYLLSDASQSCGLGNFSLSISETGAATSTTASARCSSVILPLDSWHMVTGVFKGGQIQEVYLDGVNVSGTFVAGLKQSPVNSIYSSAIDVQIGLTTTDYFNGSIDNPMIFNRALSADEVLNLYNGTRNNSNYIGKYNLAGDFKSLVFYNSTSSYWNTTLSDSANPTGNVADVNGINLSEPSLVAYWDLDGDFNDVTGRNNGTPTGTNNATGISSGAMRFDGADDYVNFTGSNFNFTSNVTFSGWAYLKASEANDAFINKRTAINTGYRVMVSSGATNKIEAVLYGTTNTSVVSTNTFATNTWIFWAVTYDGANISVYLNDVKTTAPATGAISTNTLDLHMSRAAHITGFNYINGTMDEIIIYNKSLSQAEITQLYKSGLSQHANTNVTLQYRTASSYNISDSGLVSLWGFNNDSSTTVFDETGRNNGTLNGSMIAATEGNGTLGKGYKFDGVNDYVDLSSNAAALNFSGNVTINFWVNSISDTSQVVYHLLNRSNTNIGFGIYIGNGVTGTLTNELITIAHLLGTGPSTRIIGYTTATRTELFDGKWHQITAISNGTAWTLYLDGNLKTLTVGSIGNGGGYAVPGVNGVYIGASNASTQFLNSSLDEFKIYNRTLSLAEIQDLYELGSYHIAWSNWSTEQIASDGAGVVSQSQGKFMQFKANLYSNDTITSPYLLNYNISSSPPMTINILYPTNAYYFNVSEINYTVTSSFFTLDSCWYSNSSGVWNSSSVSAGTNFTGVNTTSGTNNFIIYCNTTTNEIGNSAVTFYVDYTNPNATLLNPNNGTYLNYSNVNFSVNLTDNLGIKNATLYIYNTTGLANSTFVSYTADSLNALLGIVVTLVDGVYDWFYRIFDWAGNSYTTENRTVNIDTVPFTFNSVTSENSFAVSQFIKVNGTSFTLSGSNYTLMGADSYYLSDYATNHTYDDEGNEINNSIIYVEEILDKAQSLNINVIRTWGNMMGGNCSQYQGCWIVNNSGGHHNLFEVNVPGNYSEETFRGLDYVIYEASKRDIRLQIVLINNWDAYGGMRWYVMQSPTTNKTYANSTTDDWPNYYWSQFKDQFYTDENTRQYYRNYINYTLNRNNTYSGILYKDDPAIFAWLLANEPRAKSDGLGRSKIRNWTINMTAYIKSIDTNHLVGLGIEGFGYTETWGEGTDMISDHNGTGVDFATFELHPNQWDYFAQRSENETNLGWVTGGITSNITLDWWTTGTGYSYNNRYAGSYVPAYTPALARHGYQNWVSQNVNWSNNLLNMPVLLQELALPTNVSILSDSQKARFFNNALDNFFGNGGDGLLMWNLNHDNYYYSTTSDGIMDDGYSYYYTTDTILQPKSKGVIDAFAYARNKSYVTILNNDFYTFYYNLTLGNDIMTNCSLWLNSTNESLYSTGYYQDQVNSSQIVNGMNSFTKQFPTDNIYSYWFIRCCNNMACYDSDEGYISTPPLVDLTSPADGTIVNTTFNYLNYTVQSGLTVTSCSLYLNGLVNQTNTNLSQGAMTYQNFNVTVSTVPNSYNWQITCTDMAGNTRYSTQRDFIYDLGNFNITLISPSNNSRNNTDQNYTVYVNSSAPIKNLNLYIDGVLNYTYTVIGNFYTITYGIVVTLLDGLHSWFYEVIDIYGLNATSQNWTITLDSTKPIFVNGTPYNMNVFDNETLSQQINATDANNISCFTINDTNFNINCTGYFTNATSLSAGLYYINVTVNDTFNNINSTIFSITINASASDVAYPIFSNYWDNNGTIYNSGIALFNVTVENTNGSVFLEINGANYTAQNITSNVYNVSIPLTTGVYNYYWGSWGNGTLTLYNISEIRSYTVINDTISPNATLLNPANGTLTNTNQNFTVNLTDNLGIKNATLYIYNSTTLVNSTIFTFAIDTTQTVVGIVVNLADGIYTWFYDVFDWAANSYITTNKTVEIDKTAPVISISSLSPYPAQYGIDDVTFNWTATDAHLDTAYFIVTNSSGSIIISANTSQNIILDAGLFPTPDTYTFIVYANDTLGNNASSPSYLAVLSVLDTQAPTIVISSPISNGIYSGTSLNLPLLLNIYDVSNLSRVWWSRDNGLTNYTINAINGINYSETLSWSQGLGQLNYILTICANDTWSNQNCSNVSFYYQITEGGGGGGGGWFVNSTRPVNRTAPNITKPTPKILEELYSTVDYAADKLSPTNHVLGYVYLIAIITLLIVAKPTYTYIKKNYKVREI